MQQLAQKKHELLYKYRTINVFTGKGLLKKQRKKFKIKEYVKKV